MALWGVFSALVVSGCRSGVKGRERRVWTPYRGCGGVCSTRVALPGGCAGAGLPVLWREPLFPRVSFD